MNEDILQNIIKTRKIIMKKYDDLKSGRAESASTFDRVFEPITKPLKSIAYKQSQASPPLSINKHEIPIQKGNKKYFAELPRSKPPSRQNPALKFEDYLAFPKQDDDYANDDNDNDIKMPIRANVPPLLEDGSEIENSNIADSQANSSTDLFMDNIAQSLNLQEIDDKYGVFFDADEAQWKMGSFPVEIANDSLIINGKEYYISPGLRELIFSAKPRENKYNGEDIINYLNLIESSHALSRSFDKRNSKYRFIRQLSAALQLHQLTTELKLKAHKGKGLMRNSKNNIEYVYWDDPNELISRLSLLAASQEAGHTNHSNEIVSIIEELKERNIII